MNEQNRKDEPFTNRNQSDRRDEKMTRKDRSSQAREEMDGEEDTTLNTSGVQEGKSDEDREEDLRRRHSA